MRLQCINVLLLWLHFHLSAAGCSGKAYVALVLNILYNNNTIKIEMSETIITYLIKDSLLRPASNYVKLLIEDFAHSLLICVWSRA